MSLPGVTESHCHGTRGRPPKYEMQFARQAERLCALGATDLDLADFFEVSVRTIHRWKADHADFCHSIKAGKELADDRIEQSLYHRAVGYSHPAVKLFQHGGEIIRVEYTKHYPPDATAAIFWLKNRKPEEWRDNAARGQTPPGQERTQDEADALETLDALLVALPAE